MDRLPDFSLDDYAALLGAYLDAGCAVLPVARMPEPPAGKAIYLRHDVDYHLYRVDEMARVEAGLGVSSTYFVRVSGLYNVLAAENRAILETIGGLGHEVGLHYDLRDYPQDLAAAKAQLAFEAGLLERVTGRPVVSVSMHEPWVGHEDWFRDAAEHVNPHADRFAEGLVYVSDSCRAWRDENLLSPLGPNPPRRMLLNLHPELWMAPEVRDRFDYLTEVSARNAAAHAEEFFEGYQKPVWRGHEAVRLHEEREARESGAPEEPEEPGAP